jgi:uncharacterized protein YjbI with pentapeptide repeats
MALVLTGLAPAAHAQWPLQAQAAPNVVRMAHGYGGECHSCDLSGRQLERARFVGSFTGTNFSKANLADAQLASCNLDRATFTSAILTQANASGSKMNGANFTNAELERVNFASAQLGGASFMLAQAEEAVFSGADLREANFTLAKLTGADFSNADLTLATFDRAVLSGANLSQARGLTQKQLANACGDAETQLRPGLTLRRCN